jgi:acyl-CoA thioesterase FadM
VAAHLEVDFRAPVPLGTTAAVEPEIEAIDARKARVRGRLVGVTDGRLYAEASGVFVFLDERHRGRFAGGGA